MNTKRVLFPSLLVCAELALILRRFARRASAKPASDCASYDAIDANVEEQMRRLRIPGVSLAIVDGDKIVHLRGFGRALQAVRRPHLRRPSSLAH